MINSDDGSEKNGAEEKELMNKFRQKMIKMAIQRAIFLNIISFGVAYIFFRDSFKTALSIMSASTAVGAIHIYGYYRDYRNKD